VVLWMRSLEDNESHETTARSWSPCSGTLGQKKYARSYKIHNGMIGVELFPDDISTLLAAMNLDQPTRCI
jgi:hypothetical protein